MASVRWVTKTRVGLPNRTMINLAYRNMVAIGAPSFSSEAKDFAHKIQSNLGIAPMDDPFIADNQRLTPPDEFEALQRRSLPPSQFHIGADDYVEYSWHAPAARVFTMRPTLRPPDDDFEYPAWCRNALGGLPHAIDPGLLLGAKTLAASFLDLLQHPELLERAKAEFNERTGGGVGGSKWVAPLLPRDFTPPVDLRWPEYITTARGEEWWIPTPISDSGAGERIT